MDIESLRSWRHEDALLFPPSVAILSLLHVLLKIVRNFIIIDKARKEVPLATSDGGQTSRKGFKETIEEIDGLPILFFRLLRLLTIVVLLSLEISEVEIGRASNSHVLRIPFFVYTLGLAVLSIAASPRWRDTASLQLALLLFVDFAVFFVLDVWPYATLDSAPFDSPSNPSTWLRVILLTLGGLVIPLIMPRPFRPSTVDAKPSAFETASLLSRYTFSYVDGIIFYANRVPDITVKDMPDMPAQGKIEALAQRVLSALDPVNVGKRSLLRGLLRVWGKDYVLLNLIWGSNAVIQFTGPYGTRKLLEFLETGVSPNNLRPWTWILVLVGGPLISACLFTHFMFVASRVIVENQSSLIYLVFHHALRIRLRNKIIDSDTGKGKGKDPVESGDASSQSTLTPTGSAEEPTAEDTAESDASSKATQVDDEDSKQTKDDEPTREKTEEKTGHLLGKINTLITADMDAISRSPFIVVLPGTALQIVIAIIFLYNLLGWSSAVGLAVLIVCSPIPAYAGQLMSKFQKSKMTATDKRVQYITEALGIIRTVKLFSWEPYILKQLYHRRDEELAKIRLSRIMEVIMQVGSAIPPIFAKIVVVAIYTLVSKGELKASVIFSALLVFSMMEEQMNQLMYTMAEVLRAKISYDRFYDFLNSTELLTEGSTLRPSPDESNDVDAQTLEETRKDDIGFNQCCFSWYPFDAKDPTPLNEHHGRKQFFLRFDDEVIFKRGEINIIAGPTASGKTSVLMALLGEMYCKPLGTGAWYNLPRDGGIAHAPQESWVLNATIRDNILLAEPYDEQRYKKVLNQCALERDLALWKAGDLTEVGEKGLTLSGGQKARVTLARALYSTASILLLDDVLAALDVHTAKWIVDKALQGDLVKGRTVLLVTHNVALAAPIVGFVVDLGHHGTVAAQGPALEVLKRDSRLRAQIEKEHEEVEEDTEKKLDNDDKEDNLTSTKKTAGQLVIAEEKAIGRVEMAAIMLYITSIGGPLVWVMILGWQLLQILLQLSATWFMGYWTNQYQVHSPSEVPELKYLIVFACLNMSEFSSDMASRILWVFRSVRASKLIHSRLMKSIFSSTFRWLDRTPVGRIITRCTQDTSTVDVPLGSMLYQFMQVSLSLACLFISSCIMAGWYAFFSGLVVAICGCSIGFIYLRCQMCVRREMSNAKAPVMSQVGTALASLPTVRAYGAQRFFDAELRTRIDALARTSYCTFDVSRWVSIRIDSFGAIFSGVVAAYLTYSGRVGAGYVGFTLSIVLQFSRYILFWVRLYYMLEVQANSLERILDFMRIEHEPQPSEGGKPPAYWPAGGDLRVENLSARYSDDSPTILKDISFSVKTGERVGIVGRTGAGKSSVALALLRAIKTEGKVFYDGIATETINLDALRSNITLIPQQPDLLHGSLRDNLDPFGQYDDATLNDALSAAGLFGVKNSSVDQLENESSAGPSKPQDDNTGHSTKIGLDTMVESGGSNFSLGQRQIIALARAIVRRSKLLILDEATAAIDYATDAAIQGTLRTEFGKDTTLLTIAHRLRTIIDYDKIMVLDEGHLVEFDTPNVLLQKKDGYFRSLVDGSDDREMLYGHSLHS